MKYLPCAGRSFSVGALLFLVAAVNTLPKEANARVKLITLPVRERVESQLDNPNATLVEEERIVPLVKFNEVRGDTGRDVQWELGPQTTLKDGPDQEHTTFETAMFHAPLPAADANGKAVKTVHKLHLLLKHEW